MIYKKIKEEKVSKISPIAGPKTKVGGINIIKKVCALIKKEYFSFKKPY